jgi:hypothetical protein
MMKYYRLTGMLICFVLLVTSVDSAQEKESNTDKILSLLPKDTIFVVVMDIGRITGTLFHEQLKENEHMQEWRRGYLKNKGIDPQEELEKIVIFMCEDYEDSIFLTSGCFNKDKVIKTKEDLWNTIAKKELYQGETIYKFKEEDLEAYVLFIEDFLLETYYAYDELKSIIDIYHGKKESIKVNQTLMNDIKEAHQGNMVWAVLILPQKVKDKEEDPVGQALSHATSIFILANAQEELSISAKLKCESEVNAKNLYDFINGFIAMGKMNSAEAEKPEFVGMLLEKLTMKIKDNDVIISTSITAEYFIRMSNEMKRW